MTFGSEPTGIDHSNDKKPKDTPLKNHRETSDTLTTNPEVLLKPQPESKEAMTSLNHGMRDLRYAELIDTLRTKGGSMNTEQRQQITHSLERRKWGGVLRNLQKGDTVISTLSSTSDLLSIKNLNDNVFGSQTTDSIIAKRRQLTESILNFVLNSAGVSVDDLEHTSLEQNYKFGVFKIPEKYNLDVVAILNKVCSEVDLEMKKFIISLADDEESKHPEKATFLQNFKETVNTEGYKMTFGTAKVESGELEDVVLAVNGSLQTARTAIHDNFKDYGDSFSAEKMTAKIDQINELRNKIYQNGNKIFSKDGNNHEIFSNNAGKLELNRDLLRDVRKNKFYPQADQAQVLKDLKDYIKSLNIFDVVKPFTADEIEKIKEESRQTDTITTGVAKGDQTDCTKAAEILDRNEKDERYTSESRFHAEAVKIKNCAYLSLDVLDVGVDQLLDFEQRTQMVANKEMTFEQASLAAGDLMTKRLRQMREQVYTICEDFKITKNGRMDGLVGGDELTLAIDLDTTDENGKKIFDNSDKNLNKLIHRLKKETNSRVVKTVIAESRRHSSSDNTVQRMREHLVALKNAEDGADQAKQVETEMRKLKKNVKEHPGNILAEILLKSFEDFVIAEVDDHFVIRTENEPDINLKEIMKKLKSVYI